MTRHSLAALTLPAMLLAACTTLSPEERAAACRATDWNTYGYNDGKLGVPADQRLKMFADCAELGEAADQTAYDLGRTEGLREFCTLENGYDVGYSGRRDRRVCPPELAQGFRQGYEQGRRDRPAARPTFIFGIGSGYWHNDYWYRDSAARRIGW